MEAVSVQLTAFFIKQKNKISHKSQNPVKTHLLKQILLLIN